MNRMHVCRSCHVMSSSQVLVFNPGDVSCDSVLCCAMPFCAVLCDAMSCYASFVMLYHVMSCYFMPLARLVCVCVCVRVLLYYTTCLCENVDKCIRPEGSEDMGIQTWKQGSLQGSMFSSVCVCVQIFVQYVSL